MKDNRIRTKQMNIRVTNTEYEKIEEKANYCKLSISDYVRKQALDGAIIKMETLDIKELSNELNKIGVNINQIAKHINEKGGDYDKEDMSSLVQEFGNLQELIFNKIYGLE